MSDSDSAFDDSDDEFLDDPFFEDVYLDGWLHRKQPGYTKTSLAKKWKKRWFRPFNQFLIFSAVKDGDDNVANRIDLRDVDRIKLGSKETDFNIEILGEEPIILRADSLAGAKKWVSKLNKRMALFEDKIDFLAAKDDEMEDYIRMVTGKSPKNSKQRGAKSDENLLGVESDDDAGFDEIDPEPEVGQYWKAQKDGLHIRTEPGGREVNKQGLKEGEILTEEGRMLYKGRIWIEFEHPSSENLVWTVIEDRKTGDRKLMKTKEAPPPPGVDDDSGSSSDGDNNEDEASMAAKARVNQIKSSQAALDQKRLDIIAEKKRLMQQRLAERRKSKLAATPRGRRPSLGVFANMGLPKVNSDNKKKEEAAAKAEALRLAAIEEQHKDRERTAARCFAIRTALSHPECSKEGVVKYCRVTRDLLSLGTYDWQRYRIQLIRGVLLFKPSVKHAGKASYIHELNRFRASPRRLTSRTSGHNFAATGGFAGRTSDDGGAKENPFASDSDSDDDGAPRSASKRANPFSMDDDDDQEAVGNISTASVCEYDDDIADWEDTSEDGGFDASDDESVSSSDDDSQAVSNETSRDRSRSRSLSNAVRPEKLQRCARFGLVCRGGKFSHRFAVSLANVALGKIEKEDAPQQDDGDVDDEADSSDRRHVSSEGNSLGAPKGVVAKKIVRARRCRPGCSLALTLLTSKYRLHLRFRDEKTCNEWWVALRMAKQQLMERVWSAAVMGGLLAAADVAAISPPPPEKYFSWSHQHCCATPRWIQKFIGDAQCSDDPSQLRGIYSTYWQKRLEKLWGKRRPQALAAGQLSKYLSGTANIIEDLEDRVVELCQYWSVYDRSKRLSKSADASKELPLLAEDVVQKRSEAFLHFLLDEYHLFVTGKVEDLMMNPSFLQQSQQEELKGMIQLFQSYDEAMGRLCGRLHLSVDRAKYVNSFKREVEKMIDEYKTQIRSTISRSCDGLMTIMHPHCADDLLVRTSIEAASSHAEELSLGAATPRRRKNAKPSVDCMCTPTPSQILEVAQTLIKASIGEYVGDILTKSCLNIVYSKLADLQQTLNLRLSYAAEIDATAGCGRNDAPTMLEERPVKQAHSVISFYIAVANDLARWFSILHQLVAAGGDDDLSLDDIAGITSTRELPLADFMALAHAMDDTDMISETQGKILIASGVEALDVANPHARSWYRQLRVGFDRISWLILEASFTIACSEAAASQSNGKSKSTGNPFEGIVGPKIASDSEQAVEKMAQFVKEQVLENLQPQLLRVAFAGVFCQVGKWIGTRYFREMNRAYSRSNFLNKYELRPDHVDGLENENLFSDTHANSLNRDINEATNQAIDVEITNIIASLTRAEIPLVAEWVKGKGKKTDFLSVSNVRNLIGLPRSQVLIPPVGSKTPAMLQRLSLNRMRDIAGKGNASQPLEDIPIAKLLERLDTALVSADPWKAHPRENRSINRDLRHLASILKTCVFDIHSAESPIVANRGLKANKTGSSSFSQAVRNIYRVALQGLTDVFTEFMNYLTIPHADLDEYTADAVGYFPALAVISVAECLIRMRTDAKSNTLRKQIILRLQKLVHRAEADVDETATLVTSSMSAREVYVDEKRGAGCDSYSWAFGTSGLRWTK